MVNRIICPFCLVDMPSDRRCPRCGRVLDMGDWPPVPGNDNLAPWNAENLIPGSEKETYVLPPLAEDVTEGEIVSPLPFPLISGKSCVRIGGSVTIADICIKGAEPLHAVLLFNSRSRTWWIFDCCGTKGVFVNGVRVRLKELQSDDVIEIAKVKMRFGLNGIEAYARPSEGLSLVVSDLFFEVEGRERPILDKISFSVASGEFVGILGPSGCGKSSLVQRLTGLSDLYKGEIFVNGQNLSGVQNEFRSLSAYLPQNVDETLHPSLTLEEEIECFRMIHLAKSDSPEKDTQESGDCLRTLGLSGRENSRVGDLSGGEKRRLGIALALLRKPRMLFLDEPGAGLDPASEEVLMQHLRGIADQGRTVVCVTHVLTNIDRFDKVLVLSNGKVAYFGPPVDLLDAFNVKTFGQLYQKLDQETPHAYRCEKPVNNPRTDFPEPEKKPGLMRVVCGYLTRVFRQFNSVKKGGGFLSRLTSQPMVFFLWQPLCLVLGLRLACACYFRTVGGRPVDVEMLAFCATLSMFWIGINNSAREFVKERVPGRCLERLNGVPFMPYILSKAFWTVCVCAVQSLAFTVMLCIAGRISVPLVAPVDEVFLNITSLWFGPLYLSCLTGAVCGLSVSAVAKKQLGAISAVPNIAILALLFSNSVVRFEYGNEYYNAVARWISAYVMPCYRPSKVIEGIQTGGSSFSEIGSMLLVFAAYVAVSAFAVCFFQRRNEKEWSGR